MKVPTTHYSSYIDAKSLKHHVYTCDCKVQYDRLDILDASAEAEDHYWWHFQTYLKGLTNVRPISRKAAAKLTTGKDNLTEAEAGYIKAHPTTKPVRHFRNAFGSY